MKIEIEILGERNLVVLGRWASVSRTFDLVRQALDNPENEGDREAALEELEELHAPLSDLHMLVRTEMWKQQCSKLVREMLGNRYVCRLEKEHRGDCVGW